MHVDLHGGATSQRILEEENSECDDLGHCDCWDLFHNKLPEPLFSGCYAGILFRILFAGVVLQ